MQAKSEQMNRLKLGGKETQRRKRERNKKMVRLATEIRDTRKMKTNEIPKMKTFKAKTRNKIKRIFLH